jgi:solute carrier family 26 (sodium-independent sulfate anion transporter), member 11
MPAKSSLSHGLAKALGIKLDAPEGDVTRGESVLSIQTAETFVEEQPRTADWLGQLTPTKKGVVNYLKSLFPFLSWIGFYNAQWLVGDLVAG